MKTQKEPQGAVAKELGTPLGTRRGQRSHAEPEGNQREPGGARRELGGGRAGVLKRGRRSQEELGWRARKKRQNAPGSWQEAPPPLKPH